MDHLEQQLMNCLAAYRLGKKPAADAGLQQEDWPQLYQLARIHKLKAVVCETLWGTPTFCEGNPQLAAAWRRESILETAGQAQRTSALLRAAKAMERGGVQYAVVKGAVLRELYAQPDLRPSGDEDILIRAADLERCSEIFRQEDFVLVQAKAGDPVSHWADRQTGLHIELHTALLAGERGAERHLNRYFASQLEHTVQACVQGGAVATLPPTSHFLFLVCHALKHFITGGFGIRTVCDIVTYAERYAQDIDKTAVYGWLKTVHGRIFLDQLLSIGSSWLGSDYAAGGWTLSAPPDADEMLEDIMEAGIYGQSSMSRRHSAGVVLQAAQSEKRQSGMIATVFPARNKLVGRYPVLKRAPVLLPACWVHRLGKYAVEVLRTHKSGNSPLKSVELAKKRTEMMVKYGVLPKDQKKN